MFSKSTLLFDCDCNSDQKRLNGIKMAMQRTLLKPIKDINSNNKKESKPLEIRKEEVMAIKNRFPTKIPVIVTRYHRESFLPKLDKSKFLVPQEITLTQFLAVLRNRMKIKTSKALYVLINDKTLISLSQTMAEIYGEHACPDGFLYLTYASQEVFGSCNKREAIISECL